MREAQPKNTSSSLDRGRAKLQLMMLQKKVRQKVLLPIAAGGAVLFASGGFSACDSGDSSAFKNTTPTTGITTTIATETPAATTATTSSTETAKPTNITTPEAKVEAPCQIVPEQYCKNVEIFVFEYQGTRDIFAGFKDLPPGTPIFAVSTGQLGKGVGNGEPFLGPNGIIVDPNNPKAGTFGYSGDIQFPNNLSANVQKGDQIGVVGNSGVKDFNGEYTLVLRTSRLSQNGKGFEPNLEILRELFGDKIDKPVKTLTQSEPIKPVNINVYN